MKHSLTLYSVLLVLLLCSFCSCQKYLEEKPDKQLVTPATIQDAQAMLDFYVQLNMLYPTLPALSDDDYYLLDSYYNTLAAQYQTGYSWEKEAWYESDWANMYKVILSANMVLETVKGITPSANTLADWYQVKGGALFYRAYAHYHVAQVYAEPYDKATAAQSLGIPLRLTSDVNEHIYRPTMEATYGQIISDLQQAALLLPMRTSPVSRPSKLAAWGALARVYLVMEDYVNAGKYADSVLANYNALINYNTLDPNAAPPFTQFNAEVIFPSRILGYPMLNQTNWKVDTLLYQSYAANDLRRTMFFRPNGTGTYGFKGNYEGDLTNGFFNGIAVDELYLVRAECFARQNRVNEAMNDLNTLLAKRWKTGTFVPFTAATFSDALTLVLQERRKELVARGLRWMDLRRLNKDPNRAKTLVRKINNQIFNLPPNDPRYTYYIPLSVIAFTGIEQNVR